MRAKLDARTIQRVRFWKYVTLVVTIALLSAVLLSQGYPLFDRSKLGEGLLYSVLTALVVSLFIDAGSQKERDAQVEQDRQWESEQNGLYLLRLLDWSRLEESDIDTFVGRAFQNSEVIRRFCTLKMGRARGDHFFYSYIHPVLDERILLRAEIENRLEICCDRKSYDVHYSIEFQRSAKRTHFRVAFTSDNQAISKLAAASSGFDDVTGCSPSTWDTQDRAPLLIAHRLIGGVREERSMAPRMLLPEEISLNASSIHSGVEAFEFELFHERDWIYTYSYTVTNSLNDPYYRWTAEYPIDVRKLTIDFGSLIEHVGRITVSNLISGTLVKHSANPAQRGVVSLEPGGVLWPGTGAMVVWRPRGVRS